MPNSCGVVCWWHLYSEIDNNGVSAMEFDSKGIYLASVTKSGCLTVHDFEELYSQVSLKTSIVKEDETKQVLHISPCQPLDVVRWNLANQVEGEWKQQLYNF